MGPGLGSGLAEFDITVPFFASSGLGAFGFIFAAIFLKESHPTILKKRALKQQQNETMKKSNLKSASMADLDNDTEMENINTPRTDEDEDHDLDDMDTIKIVEETDQDRTENDGNKNEVSSKIPPQVFVLCTVNMLTSFGFTTYSSMFTLYVIDLYGLDSLSIGYITLCGAVMTVFGNIFFCHNVKIYWNVYLSIQWMFCIWYSFIIDTNINKCMGYHSNGCIWYWFRIWTNNACNKFNCCIIYKC